MKVIGIFKQSCPSGWTQLSDWDGKFLMGSSTYGGGGGVSNHSHTIDYPSTIANTAPYYYQKVKTGINYPQRYYVLTDHTHTVDISSGSSETAEHTPQCIDVVFCYYQEV